MNGKASFARSLTPQTVRHYNKAQTIIYDFQSYVPKKRYPQFNKLEKKLFVHGVMSRDYAFGLSESLQGWVRAKKWRCLPINVFCGDWAVGYFVEEIGNREYVAPSWKEEQTSLLVYDELLVARTYIQYAGVTSFANVVVQLQLALSQTWLYLYNANSRTEVKVRALDILSEEYGKYGISYEDFIEDENAGCLPVQ